MSAFHNDIKLEFIVKNLKSKFNPTRLFLYGSRATENYNVNSDYDFVMVLKEFNSKDRLQLMGEISKIFLQLNGLEVQVWTYSESDFNDWQDEFSSIPETALNTGKEISLG